MNDNLLKVTEKIIGSEELSEKLKNMKSLDEIVKFYQSLDGSITQEDVLDYLREVLACYEKVDDNSLEKVVGGKATPKNRVLASALGALTMATATPLATNTYATTGNTNANSKNLSIGKKVSSVLEKPWVQIACVLSPYLILGIPLFLIPELKKYKYEKELETTRAQNLLPEFAAILEAYKVVRGICPEALPSIIIPVDTSGKVYKREIEWCEECVSKYRKILKLERNPELKKEIEFATTDWIVNKYRDVFSVYSLGREKIQELRQSVGTHIYYDLFFKPGCLLSSKFPGSYEQIGEILHRLYEIIKQRADDGLARDKDSISEEYLQSDAEKLKQDVIDRCNRMGTH